MLIQKGNLRRSLGNFTSQTRQRFFRPPSPPTSAALQRSRLFNVLVLVELFLFLLALPATFMLTSYTRLFSSTIILFAGAALSYAVAKGGRYSLAAWLNLGGVLLALVYYNLRRNMFSFPPNTYLPDYFDFRVSSILVIVPVLVAGVVVGARVCLLLTGVSLAVLLTLGLETVPYSPAPGVDQLAFYTRLFQVPFALIIVVGLTTRFFEVSVLKLSARLCQRHHTLKAASARLRSEVGSLDLLLETIGDTLVGLEKIFEENLALAGSQETATYEVMEWENRLVRSNRQLDFLLGQAGGVLGDSQLMVAQRGEIIRTNAAVYNRLQQLLELISHSVEELGQAAVQIEQVVGSISEVAEETNLLALNASIEAAGHLEPGRRFTMVASEVYRLAIRSRDAAEEVRQVANEVQGSVVSLAKASLQGRYQAQELAQTVRSAPVAVDQLAGLMDNLVRHSASVFETIQGVQNDLNALFDDLTATTATELSSEAARQLVDGNRALRQQLRTLAEAGPKPPLSSAASNPKPPSGLETGWGTLQNFFERFNHNWVEAISPQLRLMTARRRQARLVSNMTLSYSLFLVAYFGLSLFTGFEIISLLPTAFFLVLLLLTYVLNKIGLSTYALLGAFATNYLFYTMFLFSQPSQADKVDALRVTSVVLCLTIVISGIIADIGWVFWNTLLSMALTAGLAFLFIKLPSGEILEILVYPLALQVGVGLIAGFIYYNVTRLSTEIEEQNRELALALRKAQLKKRRTAALSPQITGKIEGIHQNFENQANQAALRFAGLAGVSEKIEAQAQTTALQAISVRQIGQTVTHALEQVKAVVQETDAGQFMLTGFQGGVAEIASNSQDLKIHAGEIGQIFELITAVADEIDLLALNATLEAAQARNAGKRFGAVAGEIQRLAGRARQTGAKVQTVVSEVQEAVELCARLTERGLSELYVLTQSASETTLSARTVIEVIAAGQKLVGQLETDIHEQAELLEQLNRQLHEIVYTATTLRPKMQVGFAQIQQLRDLAAKLALDASSPENLALDQPALATETA